MDIPFELSPDQMRFAQYPKSALALGRSGTGKTTALETRIYLEELRAHKAGMPRPRQLLVTASPRLAVALQRSLKGKMNTLQKQLQATTAALALKAPRQLSYGEGALAATEAEGGLQRLGVTTGDTGDQGGGAGDEGGMLDDYTLRRLQGELPRSFAGLGQEHMPAVLTYNQLLTMMDAQLAVPFDQWLKGEARSGTTAAGEGNDGDSGGGGDAGTGWEGLGGNVNDAGMDLDQFVEAAEAMSGTDQGTSSSSSSSRADRSSVPQGHLSQHQQPMAAAAIATKATALLVQYERVDFQLFQAAYWPRFNIDLRRKLDAALVFSEILGVIKGHIEALLSPAGRLSEAEYLKLSEQRSSMLTMQQRQVVYQLFLRYEQLKGQAWQYDVMDWVWYVQRGFQQAWEEGELLIPPDLEMVHVYVDEVQDLTFGQLYLLT